jgi:hypothetical protein
VLFDVRWLRRLDARVAIAGKFQLPAVQGWGAVHHRDQFHMKAAVSMGRGRRREIRWRSSGVVSVCANLAIMPLLFGAADSFRSVFRMSRGADRL